MPINESAPSSSPFAAVLEKLQGSLAISPEKNINQLGHVAGFLPNAARELSGEIHQLMTDLSDNALAAVDDFLAGDEQAIFQIPKIEAAKVWKIIRIVPTLALLITACAPRFELNQRAVLKGDGIMTVNPNDVGDQFWLQQQSNNCILDRGEEVTIIGQNETGEYYLIEQHNQRGKCQGWVFEGSLKATP